MVKFVTNASGILLSWRDNSSFRCYTLGPFSFKEVKSATRGRFNCKRYVFWFELRGNLLRKAFSFMIIKRTFLSERISYQLWRIQESIRTPRWWDVDWEGLSEVMVTWSELAKGNKPVTHTHLNTSTLDWWFKWVKKKSRRPGVKKTEPTFHPSHWGSNQLRASGPAQPTCHLLHFRPHSHIIFVHLHSFEGQKG